MRLQLSDKPGVWSLLCAALLVVGMLCLLPAEWRSFQTAAHGVERSREASELVEQFLSAMKDAETGQRGYLLTHDAAYLSPYKEGLSQIPALSDQLAALAREDSELAAHLPSLNQQSDLKLKELERTLRLATERGTGAAIVEVQSGIGRAYMQEIRGQVRLIKEAESAALDRWNRHSRDVGQRAALLATGSVLLLAAFLLSAVITSWRAHAREVHLLEMERHNLEALHESEARFRSFADSAPAFIWVASEDKQRTYFNRGWLNFVGKTLEEVSGEKWASDIYPDDRDAAWDACERGFTRQEPYKVEFRLRHHDGRYRWMAEHGIPRRLATQEFAGFIGAAFDIDERKALEENLERRIEERTEQLRYKEEELAQSRKIEAIGRLAGGVAHDFNNLLTGIIGIAEEIRAESPPGSIHRDGTEEILKASQRASALTKQLLGFGRRQIIAPVVLDLNKTLTEMTGMLRRLIGEDVQLVTHLNPELGRVRMDPGQVEQIVINLVLNARDAMPNGGNVTIETSNFQVDEQYTKKHFEIEPGAYVLLAISDTGTGMDAPTLQHAFEPFYTTKEKGKGSGMGLATVYGIVKQNSGDIFLYSVPGSGTTFKIYLPRTAETTIDGTSITKDAAGGHETILLVEDEDIVRRMAKRSLIRAGYKVLEAQHGREALEISASFQGTIDLLLTDVIMPGLNGRQVSELLVSQRPGMRVLYTSGYTENIIAQRGMLKPGIAFIEKSFTANALCVKVREVLDTPASA